MINKNKYKNLLYETKIPTSELDGKHGDLLYPLYGYISSNFPAKLYRFRSCTDYNLDAFDKDEIWCAKAQHMNDDYDSRIYSDREKVNQWVNDYIDRAEYFKAVQMYRSGVDLPEQVKNKPLLKKAVDHLKSLSEEQLNRANEIFKAEMIEAFGKGKEMLVNSCQHSLKIACFSENLKSTYMWGQYADSGKGFALAYDFRNELTKCATCKECGGCGTKCSYRKSAFIYPVIYGNKRYDATEAMIYMCQLFMIQNMAHKELLTISHEELNQVIPCADASMFTKIALHKSAEWGKEKEWRMFCTSEDPEFLNNDFEPVKKRPVAIYLGTHIKPIYEKMLKFMAKEKGISVYRMVIDEEDHKYLLKPARVSLNNI